MASGHLGWWLAGIPGCRLPEQPEGLPAGG